MIAITGGGTGGHLSVAKAVFDELQKRGVEVIYIGSTQGQDKKWFGEYENSYFLHSSGVVNKKGIKKVISFGNILKLSFEAKKILKKHNIKKVFSVGGFSAAPASFAALFSGIPLYIHEQNAHIGSLNRILKPFSKRFFNTFFYNDPYPINEIFFKTKRVRKKIETIIFLGGSQGAKQINDLAMSVAKDLPFNIIHQTGNKDFERVKSFYEENNIKADVFAFDKEIYKKIAKADLAISRAGASTLFELSANLLPAIYIPYPFAAGDHQYFNAKFLENKKAAIVKRTLDKKEFFSILKNIDIEAMSKNLNFLKEDGVKFIVDEVLRWFIKNYRKL